MKDKRYLKKIYVMINLLSDLPHVFEQFFRITATASDDRITATSSDLRITAISDY